MCFNGEKNFGFNVSVWFAVGFYVYSRARLSRFRF